LLFAVQLWTEARRPPAHAARRGSRAGGGCLGGEREEVLEALHGEILLVERVVAGDLPLGFAHAPQHDRPALRAAPRAVSAGRRRRRAPRVGDASKHPSEQTTRVPHATTHNQRANKQRHTTTNVTGLRLAARGPVERFS